MKIYFCAKAFCYMHYGDIYPQVYPGRIIYSDWNVDLKR